MIRDRDRCEVAVIGAGPAGISCAYVLARAGVDVFILERGDYPGAKNVFGGIFYSTEMNKLLPDFYNEAPIERYVSKKRYSMLVDKSEISFHFEPEEFKKPPHNYSFIVKRAVFDRWFAGIAEKEGAGIINNVTVKDLLWDKNRVVGVLSGAGGENALLADVVVCAEGANSLLSQKAELRNRLSMRARSVAVKEVIKLPKKIIEERFNISGLEGAAYEYYGGSVSGMLGTGFVYTNRDSISVGVGVLISELYRRKDSVSPHELLERFKNHPCIYPLVKDGELLEYAAHMIPSDGYKNMPRLYIDGFLLVGDAAGLLNNSFFHEGVNMAMASGVMAAETILKNRKKKRYNAADLSYYKKLLENSFVLDDMKNCRDFLDIMHVNKELINDYPHALKSALVKYFEVSDTPKRVIKKETFKKFIREVNMTKVARSFVSMIRGGI